MDKIKIITDSTADLPQYIIKKYDIESVPLLINLGDKSYKDGIDIDLHTLFEKINSENIFPTTTQVIPQRFYDCYKKYIDEGYKIVSIHISSLMSGTYQSACIAKDMIGSNDIKVIDSYNVTSGLGLLVIKACKLKDKGYSIDKIEEEIRNAIPHVNAVLSFERLDYLVKGGRLSKTAGIIGNVLDIRPILSVKNGKLIVIDKVRGNKKSIRYILDYINEKGFKDGEVPMLLNSQNKDIFGILKNDLIEKKLEFIECEVGCTVGINAGPGACGVFFIEKY